MRNCLFIKRLRIPLSLRAVIDLSAFACVWAKNDSINDSISFRPRFRSRGGGGMTFHVPEDRRFRFPKRHPMYSDASYGNNGAFLISLSRELHAVASDGGGWEHVSISAENGPPTWAEMCEVKALFWDDDDCVVQYHPPKRDYVNYHPNCLHLWRPVGVEIPRPPIIFVGPV